MIRFARSIFRKPEKLSAYKFHRSLETLPIWNWHQLHKHNDVKYLLQVNDFEGIELTKDFKKTLQGFADEMVYEFDDLNLGLIIAQRDYKIKLLELIADIAKNSKDPEKLDLAFHIIINLAVTEDPDVNWLWEQSFTDTASQRAMLTEASIAIMRYKDKRPKGEEQSLIEKATRVEVILGIPPIDLMVCPVLKFKEYEKQAIEKINARNKSLQ